jgi:hypothetical protein
MGKGSAARPFSVSRDVFSSNFDAIFGKKEKVNVVQQTTEDATGKAAKTDAEEKRHDNGGDRQNFAINNPNTPNQ